MTAVTKRTLLAMLISGLALLMLPFAASAQETGTITGTVTDAETGESLPGTSILIVETQQGAATDENGSYTIENVEPGTYTMQASFVGYQEQRENIEVTVSAGETVTQNFTLTPSYTDLEEVVVVGYGTQNRREVTGSVSTVDATEIQNVPVSSPEELLQGRTAGVQLTKSSGLPGASINVDIRGTASIESGTEPLYVIDGVPVASGTSASFFGADQNALQTLNPSDIQSMEVLKDASATAIYGSRAANGVVLITTKTGTRSGQTDVNFGYYAGSVSSTSEWDVLDGSQYATIVREASAGYFTNVLGFPAEAVPADPVTPLIGGPGFPTAEEAQTYSYVDRAFRNGFQQQFDLSARGGNESTRFYVSGTYYDTEGYVLGNRFQRINGRINLDHDINDWARVGTRTGVTRVLNDRASSNNNVSGILSSAALRPPILPFRNENGSFNWDNPYNIGENIVASAAENDSDDYEWRVNGKVFAEIDPIENLTLRATGGLDLLTTDEYFLNVAESVDGRPNGAREQDFREQRRYLLEGTADYTNTFGDNHIFNLIAGGSYERNERVNVFAIASNFATNALRNVGPGAEPTFTSSEVDRKWRLLSTFARANYTFDDRYIFEASARLDGSTRFSEDNRYGFFPAGAVAWRVSEESFMEPVEVVDELKFRVSYGVTGNDQIGTFPYLALFDADSDANYGEEPGLSPAQLPSEDLKWETVNQLDVGMDLGLFNQRVFLTADFYNKNTTDLILPVQLSRTSGYNDVVRNVGNLRNRGFEFALETQNLTGAFNWSTQFNISTNSNEVTELVDQDGDGEGDPIPGTFGLTRIEEGRPLGSFYMIPYEGVDPETGLPQFRDADGEITNTPVSGDRRFVGNLNPDWTGGLTNRLSFKGVELSFLLQFETGGQFYNSTKAFLMNPTTFNLHEDILDRWQEPGDQTDVPKLVFADIGVGGTQESTRFLESRDYLRLKDVTLSYAIPAEFARNLGIGRARIYVKGHNLLTFDELSIGDPEAGLGTAVGTSQGEGFFTPPQQRSIQAGFDITL